MRKEEDVGDDTVGVMESKMKSMMALTVMDLVAFLAEEATLEMPQTKDSDLEIGETSTITQGFHLAPTNFMDSMMNQNLESRGSMVVTTGLV